MLAGKSGLKGSYPRIRPIFLYMSGLKKAIYSFRQIEIIAE
jgi:hypothetical protein